MKKIPNSFLYLTVLSLPFFYFRFSLVGIPTTLVEILVYLTFITFLLTKRLKLNIKFLLIGLIFLLGGLLSALIDPNLLDGLGLWKAYFFDGFLFAWCVYSLEKHDIEKALIPSLIFSGGICALVSLLAGNYKDGRLLDLALLSPNYLGMFLTPILLLAITKIIYNKKINTLLIGAALAMLVAIFLSGSRGALLAITVGSILIFINWTKSIRLKYVSLGFILIVLLGSLWYFRPDFTRHDRKQTSSNIRYEIWKTSLIIIKQRPVTGVGLSNYQNYFSKMTSGQVNYPEFVSPQALTAHNIFLNLFAVGGIILLLSFLVFLSQLGLRLNPATIAVWSIIIYGLVDTPFFRNDLALLFWILVALTQNVTRKKI